MNADPMLSSPYTAEPRTRATPSRGYVLVVAGDRHLRGGLVEHLRLEGFGVVGVEDGLDALLQLFTGEPLPDAVVFDEDGPGMSGAEFRALMRRNPGAAGVPVVVLGSAPPAAGEPALAKPCRPEALVRAVTSAVARRPAS